MVGTAGFARAIWGSLGAEAADRRRRSGRLL